MSGRREERLKVRARRCAALLASVFVTSLAGQVLIGPVAAQAATAPRAPAPILPPAHPPAPPAIAPAPESYTTFSHSKRDASGRVTAQLFTVPQFRRQGGGWVPIDASVRPRNDRVQPLSAEGGLRPIRLGSSASRLVELELDRGPVTMSAPSLSIGAPEATLGGATYHNVAADTDLRYRVSAGGIKEEVVLRSPQSPRQFTFHIDDPRGQLGAAHRQADGSYRFDGRIDDAVVSLAAPAAYPEPKAGVRGGIPMDRRSAHMAVKPVGKGVDVTLSVDASWLVGKSFPIVLDPDTIMSQGVSLAGHSEYSPDFCGTGCGLNTTDDVGAYTGYSREGHQLEPMRSFYKFDLSSIPFGSAVSSATFSQYLVGCGDGAGCGQYAYSFEVHPMTGPWDQYSIWSDLAAKTSSTVTDHVEVAPITCSPCGSESWNVSGLVGQWVNGTMDNNGFSAKLWAEPPNFGGALWSYLGQYSNYPHPSLQVTYTPNPNATTWGGNNQCQCKTASSTANPVNTATGDFWHTFTDVTVPGRGMPLSFGRTYNSLAASQSGRLGYGWTDSYAMSLTNDGFGNLTVHQENGATSTFRQFGPYYLPAPGVLASLTANGDGTYTFKRADQVAYVFSGSGQLLKEIDRNGYVTTLSYSGAGLLAGVWDPGGRALSITYDGSSRITGITDAANRHVGFFYDAAGNLFASQDLRGFYTIYGYDGAHLLTTITDPNDGVLTNYYESAGINRRGEGDERALHRRASDPR